jgi:putative sterol carrier protein
MAIFPTDDWLVTLKEKLNTDARYAEIAKSWEGDIRFVIEPGGAIAETMAFYLDLWHGKCREAFMETELENRKPAFVLKARYDQFTCVLKGELDPMQAMLTRKLGVTGNLAVMMRNIPTVLDFVRCCKEVTTSTL